MELDDTICYCFHVSQRKICNYIRINKLRRASQVSDCGGAGSGCGWCIPFIEKLFDESERRGEVQAISADEYARARGSYIRAGKGKPPAGATPPPAES
ncbi:MAG: (2Fe-2S)-binding protein [Planctomycetota bacterium]|nr:(2Fe-2S)-binding protein [Planctomycetota bacterium]